MSAPKEFLDLPPYLQYFTSNSAGFNATALSPSLSLSPHTMQPSYVGSAAATSAVATNPNATSDAEYDREIEGGDANANDDDEENDAKVDSLLTHSPTVPLLSEIERAFSPSDLLLFDDIPILSSAIGAELSTSIAAASTGAPAATASATAPVSASAAAQATDSHSSSSFAAALDSLPDSASTSKASPLPETAANNLANGEGGAENNTKKRKLRATSLPEAHALLDELQEKNSALSKDKEALEKRVRELESQVNSLFADSVFSVTDLIQPPAPDTSASGTTNDLGVVSAATLPGHSSKSPFLPTYSSYLTTQSNRVVNTSANAAAATATATEPAGAAVTITPGAADSKKRKREGQPN